MSEQNWTSMKLLLQDDNASELLQDCLELPGSLDAHMTKQFSYIMFSHVRIHLSEQYDQFQRDL